MRVSYTKSYGRCFKELLAGVILVLGCWGELHKTSCHKIGREPGMYNRELMAITPASIRNSPQTRSVIALQGRSTVIPVCASYGRPKAIAPSSLRRYARATAPISYSLSHINIQSIHYHKPHPLYPPQPYSLAYQLLPYVYSPYNAKALNPVGNGFWLRSALGIEEPARTIEARSASSTPYESLF